MGRHAGARRARPLTVLALVLVLLGCAARPSGAPVPSTPRDPAPRAGEEAGAVARERPPVWSFEFDGPARGGPPAGWRAERGAGWGDGELQAYTDRAANVAVDGDGHLVLIARREAATDARGRSADFTSARLQTLEARTMTRLEARIRVPSGQGLWPAFWTLGASADDLDWPRRGEIDVLEVVDDAGVLMANVHAAADEGAGTGDGSWQQLGATPVPPLSERWHVYSVDWTPEALVFALDGEVHHVVARPADDGRQWPFDDPQHVLLNIAVTDTSGVFDAGAGPPTSSTPFPARMLVDYVRAYG